MKQGIPDGDTIWKKQMSPLKQDGAYLRKDVEFSNLGVH